MSNGDKTVVVGDVHVGPSQNLRRARWLGRYVRDVSPNRVVFIGDLATFDSLSAWDKDKRKKMEGRRYQKDVDSLAEFVDIFYSEVGPSPSFKVILTEGNHEDRIARYVDYNPVMDGNLDYLKDSGIDNYDWKIVPYREFFNYKGISFTHVPLMENGRPVSGQYATRRALEVCRNSVVFGHTHKLDYKSVHRHGQPHLQEALNVGCYFEHIDDYAKGSVTSYWRGLVTLDHYSHGRFAFEAIPLGLLKRKYGD